MNHKFRQPGYHPIRKLKIILSGLYFAVDESLLTGESVPVRKRSIKTEEQSQIEAIATSNRPGGDDLPCVYSGTLVVQGQGIAQVQATGVHTEMGKIGKALQTVEQEDTVLQKETRRVVSKLTIVAIAICVAVVVIYDLIPRVLFGVL